MKTSAIRLFIGASALLLGGVLPNCSSGYGTLAPSRLIKVEFDQKADPGTRSKLLPFPGSGAQAFDVRLSILNNDGSVDTSFNGYLRLNTKPGTVVSVTGDGATGRNALLTDGVSPPLTVAIAGAFGETHILAEDLGYTPVDPSRNPPPQCADGIDNDEDGLVDFPGDVGCAFPNDDTETGGSFSQGASPTIFYSLPRVADVRGVSQGGGATAFPSQQVSIDCGWDDTKESFRDSKNLPIRAVVTRIAPDGFYVSDLDDPRGYNGIFAFNFNAPPNMRVCDRLKSFRGTAVDFYGFTEMSFPTWTLEEWDPCKGTPKGQTCEEYVKANGHPPNRCIVPEPIVLSPALIGAFKQGGGAFEPNKTYLLNVTASLVRVGKFQITSTTTNDDGEAVTVTTNTTAHVAKHFGPNPVPKKGGTYEPADDASNCDSTGDGKIDFSDPEEKACADACDADPECSEYNDFLGQSAFVLVVSDGTNTAKIQADGSQSAGFNALNLRGKDIGSFSGTLRYFSGGSQFTIEARCSDDIITDPKGTPISSENACVHARTEADLQSQ